MDVILNIGLDNVPVDGETYTNGIRNPRRVEQLFAVVHTARRLGFTVITAHLRQSNSEPTAVLAARHAAPSNLHGYVRQLAAALDQTCIAAWKVARQHGVMLGATIDLDGSWGPFNPELFLMPDGTRLSETLARAA
jgi:hypothetical protein